MVNKLPKGIIRKDQIPKDAKVIDKGTVVIKDEKKDYAKLLNFIKALSEGDETYKPAGLEINKKELVSAKKTASSTEENPFMQDKKLNIKYLH